MAVSLQVTDLGKSFNNLLFDGVNLVARSPARIGLIGDNGSGKSTFLKMLAGRESIEQGEVEWSKSAKIGYLEQEITSDTFDVSGGEKKILKISELFYGDYDVLLLDEPDNHLDLDHKIWFEQLVKEWTGILIVISHDRNFLTNAVNKIWQLEEKKIKEYGFGYEKFKEIYEGEMASRQHLWETQEKERIRLAELIVRFRVQAAANDKFSGRLHSAEKRYDRFVEDMVAKPPAPKKITLKINLDEQHKRKTAVFLQNVTKAYDKKPVLTGVDLHLFCGEKIAINAPNGSGKSTLLNIIAGRLNYDEGEFSIGPGLKIGYYTQEHLQTLDEQATLVEELQKSGSFAHYDAIAYLKKFLFDSNAAKTQVRLLSGGQKSRLQLAKFLALNPDILILDEPTNHLDLRTVLALENFLKEYAGTLILVSHDREMVNNVVNKVFILKDGKLKEE